MYIYLYIYTYTWHINISMYIYIMYICIFNVSYLRFISLINEFLDSRCQRAQGAARGWRLRMCLENTRIDASNIFASSTLIILIPENDAARSYQISGCLSQFEYVDGQAAPSSEAGHSLSGASGRRDVQERCAERKTSWWHSERKTYSKEVAVEEGCFPLMFLRRGCQRGIETRSMAKFKHEP